MSNHKLNLIFLCLIFAASFLVYILTLTPTVYLEDSGEFIAVADSLGIAHPSGYPIYVILAKLFTYLPLGSLAFRVNLMSAFFGALTCTLVFLVIQRINKSVQQKSNQTKKQQNNRSINQEIDTPHKQTIDQLNSQGNRLDLNTLILDYLVPLSASLILAFSFTFWSQNLIAEVYTLNTFFLSLIILLLLRWASKRNHKYLLLVAFLFGLSLTNHQMMILFLPAFLIFIFVVDKMIIFKKNSQASLLKFPYIKNPKPTHQIQPTQSPNNSKIKQTISKIFTTPLHLNYKLIIGVSILFLLGISVYAFLVLRTRYGHPDFVWGDPYNWQNFKNHLLRKQYDDFGSFSGHTFFNQNKLLYINSLFELFLAEFTLVGLLLSLVGFIYLWFKEKKIWLLLCLAFLANSFLIIIIRKGFYNITNDLIFQVYYLPAFLIITVFVGLGISCLIGFTLKTIYKSDRLPKTAIKAVIILILCFIPASYLINNYQLNDRSDFWLADYYSRRLLESLKPGSKLFVYTDQPAWDSITFSIMYQQVVNNLRPDVKTINVSNIKGKFYVPVGDIFKNQNLMSMPDNQRKTNLAEILWRYNDDDSPIYLLYSLGIGYDEDLTTRSNGWAYQIYANLDQAKNDNQYYQDIILGEAPNLNNSNLINNLFYRDLVSEYYYARAAYYLETGQNNPSQNYLLQAVNFDTSPLSANYNLFVQHQAIWQGKNPLSEVKLVPKELLNKN